MNKPVQLLAALLVAVVPLAVQAAVGVAPDSGTILQQTQPIKPQVPSSNAAGVTIDRPDGGKLPPSAPFWVKTIQISGNTVFDTQVLHALVADAEGQSISLPQLGELASRITAYYQSHGYPLARAIVPAQTIQAAMVRLDVVEGRYGRISLDNHSAANNALLEATLSSLQSGQVIDEARLNRSLLLLSDVPGLAVGATMKPGETVGTSDLQVQAESGTPVSGSVMMDNYGSRYTGKARLGGAVSWIEPLHHGDVLNVSGLSSGAEMKYGRLSYESLVNGQGTRVGGSWSSLHYVLGASLAPLAAHGTAEVQSLWTKKAWVRSRDVNLYGQIQYDRLKLRDHLDVSAIRTDRHLENWVGNLSGDARDNLGLGGISTWNLGMTIGNVGFDNNLAQLVDAAAAKTQGAFCTWSVNLARLQSLGPQTSLYLAYAGQWANANLDSSQKMSVGGPYAVRAYDAGALSGDVGHRVTAELRHELGAAWGGQWQAQAFVDTAHVRVNESAWAAGPNSATVKGAGVGISWVGDKTWSAKLVVAEPIGVKPDLIAGTRSARAWLEVSRAF